MKKNRLAIALSAAVVLLVGVNAPAAEGNALHSAIRPEARGGGHMRRHRETNERLRQGNVDLLMIGDSITHSWDGKGKAVWDEFYAGRNAVNLGRSGERTQHVLWRLDNLAVENISPKLAVVLIGTNNTKDNTADQIAEAVTLIIRKLRQKLPRTKILLLAIFPNGPNDADPRRQVARNASQLYSKAADGEMVLYMDLRDHFVKPDGTPTNCLRSDDLLHLSVEGYRAWAEAIEPMVARILGPRNPSGGGE